MAEIHSIGPFILGKTLGEGATGKVKLAFHRDTGFKVAIKIIKKDQLMQKPSLYKKVEREIAVLKVLDHPNVVKLYEVYETSKYLFLITEYIDGGELFDYIISKGCLEAPEALKFFQMLIHGVDYCHSNHICHRDLKPENLLLDSNKNLKLADFGMAAVMKPGEQLATSCGSPHYASPEVVMGIKYDGRLSDTWSCGVILYALTSGKLPFDDDNIRVLLRKVKTGVFQMPPFLHRDVKDLISKMLVVNPQERMTIKDVKQHVYFLSNKSADLYPPIKNLEDSGKRLREEEIDSEILSTLESLLFGTKEEIKVLLTSDERTICRAMYWILLREKDVSASESRYQKNPIKLGEGRKRSHSFAPQRVAPSPPLITPVKMPPIQSPTLSIPLPLTPGKEKKKAAASPLRESSEIKTLNPNDIAFAQTGERTPTPSKTSPHFLNPVAGVGSGSQRHIVLPRVGTPVTSDSPQLLSPLEEGVKNKNLAHLRPTRRSSVSVGSNGAPFAAAGVAMTSDAVGERLQKLALKAAEDPVTPSSSPVYGTSPAKKSFWSNIFGKKEKHSDIEGSVPDPVDAPSIKKEKGREKEKHHESKHSPSTSPRLVITSAEPVVHSKAAPPLPVIEDPEEEEEAGQVSNSMFRAAMPLPVLKKELERVMGSLGVQFTLNGETQYRAKYLSIEGASTVDFTIEMTLEEGAIMFEFKQMSGDQEQYNDMLSAVQFELKLK
eukprot:TRINITY_DN795_c0_g1_i4.p1 TRINITY_DN795_c0_g1~~TRINITY_DN795_c0_g1_i4.p1  ORF type:complete len:731 (-),score=191.70 TRINITY_DN795_c0_g1_i4:87-2246(-)